MRKLLRGLSFDAPISDVPLTELTLWYVGAEPFLTGFERPLYRTAIHSFTHLSCVDSTADVEDVSYCCKVGLVTIGLKVASKDSTVLLTE